MIEASRDTHSSDKGGNRNKAITRSCDALRIAKKQNPVKHYAVSKIEVTCVSGIIGALLIT